VPATCYGSHRWSNPLGLTNCKEGKNLKICSKKIYIVSGDKVKFVNRNFCRKMFLELYSWDDFCANRMMTESSDNIHACNPCYDRY
jgi:hypothetical protein